MLMYGIGVYNSESAPMPVNIMIRHLQIILFSILVILNSVSFAECQNSRVTVQVLGSGGPELTDGRASSSYLVWLDGKALVMVDAGSGSSFNYEKSTANLNDLQTILFTHFHVDHSADLPAYIKGAYFSNRVQNLNIFGPENNHLMPSANEYVHRLLGDNGAFSYLQEYLSSSLKSRYKIMTTDVALTNHKKQTVFSSSHYSLVTIPVHHGPIPALAWRINLAGCSITFSGDMSNHFHTLAILAKGTDLLIAHNAIPESQTGVGRQLHMPPSEIGKIAKQANVKKLILSHRMNRTLGREQDTLREIRQYYQGSVLFAEDMDSFILSADTDADF